MKNLKRADIIAINNEADKSVLFESCAPYLGSLYIYYKSLFCCEPVVMVTDMFNAAQYIKFVPSNEFNEAIDEYLNTCIFLTSEDEENEKELINFNSKLLKDILTTK